MKPDWDEHYLVHNYSIFLLKCHQSNTLTFTNSEAKIRSECTQERPQSQRTTLIPDSRLSPLQSPRGKNFWSKIKARHIQAKGNDPDFLGNLVHSFYQHSEWLTKFQLGKDGLWLEIFNTCSPGHSSTLHKLWCRQLNWSSEFSGTITQVNACKVHDHLGRMSVIYWTPQYVGGKTLAKILSIQV